MAVRAGGSDGPVPLCHYHREGVAKIVRYTMHTMGIHMAVSTGHPGYGLLVRYVHASRALQNIVTQMVGVREPEITVTSAAKLA